MRVDAVMRPLAVLLALSWLAVAAPAPAATVVGGSETAREWPWMVYLDQGRQELELGDHQYCGGTLIAATWVMTAAHCINDATLDPLLTTVVVGRHARSASKTGERIQARRILVDPQYAPHGDDVALVELDHAPANPRPVTIAGPGEEALWTAGRPGTILGWGSTTDGGPGSDVLEEATVPIVADEECGRAYADPSWRFDAAIMLCAGYPQGGADTCQGDSGGPLVVAAADGSWRQVGITSFGEGCARAGYPGVYAEVAGAPLRDWIAGYVPGAIAPPAPAPVAGPAPAARAPAKRSAKKRVSKRCKRPKRHASRRAKARYRRCVAKRKRAARRRRAG